MEGKSAPAYPKDLGKWVRPAAYIMFTPEEVLKVRKVFKKCFKNIWGNLTNLMPKMAQM